jgi:hypothetical protein
MVNNVIKFGFIGIIVCLLVGFTAKKKPSTIPPGMALVPGNEQIRPFLISANPVSNFEYLVYLEWKKQVFIDYPEVWEKAIPKSIPEKEGLGFNDPYEAAYMGHPAYSDYPVKGVNWVQAMEYCAWRTDRYNEAMCIELGHLNWQKEIHNTIGENNFNTEAYLNGQFMFSGKFEKYDTLLRGPNSNGYMNEINRAEKYPFFLYGGRLPTEEEWDYYQTSGVKANNYYQDNSLLQHAQTFKMNSGLVSMFRTRFKEAGKAATEAGFTEWMLDIGADKQTYKRSYERMFSSNSHSKAEVNFFLDSYGSLDAKDSLGAFGFRIMDWKASGEALLILKPGYQIRKFVSKVYMPEKSFLDSIPAWYHSGGTDTFRLVYGRPFTWWNPKYLASPLQLASLNTVVVHYKGLSAYAALPTPFLSVQNDIAFLQTEATYAINLLDTCIGCENPLGGYRTRKSKTERKKGLENIGYESTGFRIVFPWYGNALPEPIAW